MPPRWFVKPDRVRFIDDTTEGPWLLEINYGDGWTASVLDGTESEIRQLVSDLTKDPIDYRVSSGRPQTIAQFRADTEPGGGDD